MKLDAYEFEHRADEFFISHYLSTVGVVQSVAVGLLAVKWFGTEEQSYIVSPQGFDSFIVITLIVTEYSWWLLLVRRTPTFIDTLVPYALGMAEFVAMTYVDHIRGEWFLGVGALGVMGVLSLLNNRRYYSEDLFSECPWLLPMIKHNTDKSVVLVTGMTLLVFGAWIARDHIPIQILIAIYVALSCAAVVSLGLSALFLNGVAWRFDAERSMSMFD